MNHQWLSDWFTYLNILKIYLLTTLCVCVCVQVGACELVCVSTGGCLWAYVYRWMLVSMCVCADGCLWVCTMVHIWWLGNNLARVGSLFPSCETPESQALAWRWEPLFAEPSCFSSALILRQGLTVVTQASLEFEICLSLLLYLTVAAIYNTVAIFNDVVLSSCCLTSLLYLSL